MQYRYASTNSVLGWEKVTMMKDSLILLLSGLLCSLVAWAIWRYLSPDLLLLWLSLPSLVLLVDNRRLRRKLDKARKASDQEP